MFQISNSDSLGVKALAIFSMIKMKLKSFEDLNLHAVGISNFHHKKFLKSKILRNENSKIRDGLLMMT